MKPELKDLAVLWARYQPLVAGEIASVRSRYGYDYHLEYDDLESVALETLWQCIERFDPSLQTRKSRDPLALFTGFYKESLYRHFSAYAKKVIPHYYVGHGSKARWHHVKMLSFDQLTEDQQDRKLKPEAA